MQYPQVSLLVVDDQSPGTVQLPTRLRASIRDALTMHRTGQRGLGRAYIDGIACARETFDLICQMDWYLPRPAPAAVPPYVQPIRHGSRYIPAAAFKLAEAAAAPESICERHIRLRRG
jgi:hypothetical protein